MKTASLIALAATILGALTVVVSQFDDSAGSEPIPHVVRRNLKSLVLKGNDGKPSSSFPLGECEGDCDIDADCAGDLICFQRNRGNPVPAGSCSGAPQSNWDYCVKPKLSLNTPTDNAKSPSLTVVGNNGMPNSAFPLGMCRGDCDNDNECAGNLVCFQRDGNEPVPGCSMGSSSYIGIDFCTDSGDGTSTSLSIKGDNGSPSSAFPLGECQGDCDSDRDCRSGLKCFQRTGTRKSK